LQHRWIQCRRADVAERINTREWVEAGDEEEIDPDHAGFVRKAAELYSLRVAGIIFTYPSIILGNNIDSQAMYGRIIDPSLPLPDVCR